MNIITRALLRTALQYPKYPLVKGRKISSSNRLSFRENSSLNLAVRNHGDFEYQDPKSEDEVVNVTFMDKTGKRIPLRGKIGDNLLYLGHRFGVEIEGRATKNKTAQTKFSLLLQALVKLRWPVLLVTFTSKKNFSINFRNQKKSKQKRDDSFSVAFFSTKLFFQRRRSIRFSAVFEK